MIRILFLCLALCLAAACGGGSGGAPRDGDVRFDTVAGYQLGMLLPEAREAAAAHGEDLRCTRELDSYGSTPLPDSSVRLLRDLERCEPPHDRYLLFFHRSALQSVVLPYSDEWNQVPVEALVARLSAKWGKPKGREEYTYEDGRREILIYWQRRGLPGEANLRCLRGSLAGECTLVHHRGRIKRD
ncbi:hypothetical protein [Longimicrobium sp.]|uniref:hypothetical protein n=1 Tax=Longimicrobium sp. TaxID=2029185 RepID=UPI002E328339|nr:hypothetical protein [Longimicrobium sp.]HEX6038758.1 hypothetical protein [Longimicrobium sp.]